MRALTYISWLHEHGTDPLFLQLKSVGHKQDILSAHQILFPLGFQLQLLATYANKEKWAIEPLAMTPLGRAVKTFDIAWVHAVGKMIVHVFAFPVYAAHLYIS